MVINTPDASGTKDSFSIRRTALELRLPYFTTMAGAKAAVEGIFALKNEKFEVRALQDYHRRNGKLQTPSRGEGEGTFAAQLLVVLAAVFWCCFRRRPECLECNM